MNLAVGYYDSPTQTDPAFDPGLDVDCPICCLPLDYPAKQIKTISLMPMGETERSAFYRTHKGCREAQDERERGFLDAAAMEAAGCPLKTQSKEGQVGEDG